MNGKPQAKKPKQGRIWFLSFKELHKILIDTMGTDHTRPPHSKYIQLVSL